MKIIFHQIYWTDIGTKSINSARLDGAEHRVLATDNVQQPTGLALDSVSKNIYWTDEGIFMTSVSLLIF